MNNIRLNDAGESVVDINAYAVFQKVERDGSYCIDAITCQGNSIALHYETEEKRDEDLDTIGFHKGAR